MTIPARMMLGLTAAILTNQRVVFIERKKFEQYRRNHCIDCNDPIPPGKAGRKCKVCRENSARTTES